ncbi:hypothetical protein JCM10049v2_002144 [Rhodotorula toruloides]
MLGFNLHPLDPLVFLLLDVPPAGTSADPDREGTEQEEQEAVEGGALATSDAVVRDDGSQPSTDGPRQAAARHDTPARVHIDLDADDDGALRRTVLFASNKTFGSKAKFVASSKRRILRSHGVTSWLYQNEPRYAVVVCSRRPERCGFRVRAEKVPGETRWALQSTKCVWEHNHDMVGEEREWIVSSSSEEESESEAEDEDERTPGKLRVAQRHLRPLSGTGKRRSATAAARSTTRKIEVIEIDGSSSSSGSDGEGLEVESGAGDVSLSSKNIPPPGLPTPTDRFASANDAYLAYVRALIPVYGIGVTLQPTSSGDVEVKCNKYFRPPGGSSSDACRWMAVVTGNPKTKRWRINFDESCFDHSHGPAQQILDDPSWRPIVRNPAARKALGMRSSLVTSSVGKKSDAAVAQKASQERTERKKKRDDQREKGKAEDVALPSNGTEPALGVLSPLKKRRRHIDGTFAPGPSRTTTSLFFASPLPSAGADSSVRHEAPEYRPLAYPPTFASLPATRPVSASFSAHPVFPALSSLVPLPSVDISAFLYALHPSLEPLTPHLIASGFTTVESLASLALLDSAILSNVLDLVRTNAASATTQSTTAPAPPAVVQLSLLAKSLKAAGRA